MRFFGWVFLILGVLNVLFMPIFALFLIVIGILLISFGFPFLIGRIRTDRATGEVVTDTEVSIPHR